MDTYMPYIFLAPYKGHVFKMSEMQQIPSKVMPCMYKSRAPPMIAEYYVGKMDGLRHP